LAFKLVIFDFDGTLSNSFPAVLNMLDELALRFRVKRLEHISLETLRGYSARSLLKMHRVPLWRLPSMVRFTRKKMNSREHPIELFEGVGDLLNALHTRNVRMAVVTTNTREYVREILGNELFGMISFLEDKVSIFGKPAALKRVLRKSGIKREETLAIGDELRDLQAAQKVMIPFGAVSWGFSTLEALVEQSPSFVFTSLEQIVDAVDGLPEVIKLT
jgi:phosphoglycolate phosphatase